MLPSGTRTDWPYPPRRAVPEDPAAYWPDTCFLELPELPLSDEEIAKCSPDGRDAPALVGEYYALVAHEHTHWIQAHAFSYGRLQAQIDQARTELSESFFALLSSEQLKTVLERRARGKAIVRLGKDFRPVVTDELGAIVARLQRHWWGLWLLRRDLDQGPSATTALQSSRFRLGLTALYADAGPDVSSVALLTDEALRNAAFDRAPDEELEDASSASELDTAAIAECSAVLNQHWLYAYNSEWYRKQSDETTAGRYWHRLDQSWTSKEPTFYGDAFRVFQLLNPTLDLNSAVPLATLGVVCCVSLDGPSPLDTRDRVASWNTFFPPARFKALARAVGVVGTLPSHTVCRISVTAYHDYVRRLCDAAKVPPPNAYRGLGPSRQWSNSPANDLRWLHHDAASAAAALMAELPAAVVAPAEASVYLEERLMSTQMAARRLAFEAPLVTIAGRFSPTFLDKNRLAHCAVGGIYQRLMLNLMGACAALPEAGRPTCSEGRLMAETAVNLAESRLSVHLPSS